MLEVPLTLISPLAATAIEDDARTEAIGLLLAGLEVESLLELKQIVDAARTRQAASYAQRAINHLTGGEHSPSTADLLTLAGVVHDEWFEEEEKVTVVALILRRYGQDGDVWCPTIRADES